MDRIDGSGRLPAARYPDQDLLEIARQVALDAGLSEDEWESALRRARRGRMRVADELPLPLLVDSWTFH